MESTVKAAMLKSSHVLGPAATATAPAPTRGLRRVQSGSSIESPLKGSAAVLDHPHTANGATTTPDARGGPSAVTATTTSAHHSRGVSIDVPRRPKSRSGFTTSAADLNSSTARGKVFSPVQIVSLLTGQSSLELEVDVVKKLRLLLRNEAAR
jgi:hypothetical protein